MHAVHSRIDKTLLPLREELKYFPINPRDDAVDAMLDRDSRSKILDAPFKSSAWPS
jgi:hypothetical protein